MTRSILAAVFAATLASVPMPADAAKPAAGLPVKHAAPARPPKPQAVKPAKGAPPAPSVKPSKAPRLAQPAKPLKAPKSPKDTKSASAKPARSTSPSAPVALTPVQQKLQKNTRLAAKLETRLTAGTDLMRASDGFKNLGQFVAAVNVSNNHGIPFADLKAKMVTDGMSLGQSIQALRPGAGGSIDPVRSEREARVLIAKTERTPAAGPVAQPTTTSKATPRTQVKARSRAKLTS